MLKLEREHERRPSGVGGDSASLHCTSAAKPHRAQTGRGEAGSFPWLVYASVYLADFPGICLTVTELAGPA